MFINFRSILEPYAQKYNNCILKFVGFYVDFYSILESYAQKGTIYVILIVVILAQFGLNLGSILEPQAQKHIF